MKKKPIKNITLRHELILQKLQEDGRVSIQDLSDEMQVSGVTIRKDLKLLEDKNLLFRTHGVVPSVTPTKLKSTSMKKN